MAEPATIQTRCPRCGDPLSAGIVEGFCPRCLATNLFGEDESPSGRSLPFVQFAGYELIEEIARGGMGVVYRARQHGLGREVAVKLLRDGFLAGADDVGRFRVEALAAASLQHPHIVGIHEIGEHAGQPFFSMELIAGQNLAQLTREGPMPARRAAEVVAKIARAVAHAHGRGVLHRDLKPSNVIVDPGGDPHVTDFGLARRVDSESRFTLTGQVLGTPGYMAPEQALGRSGPLADVYSLGAVLYHLITGRAPFVGETPTAVLNQLAQAEPVAPRLLNPQLPRDLETICLRTLAKEPERRYSSAQSLADDLGRFLAGEPIFARPVTQAERLVRWCRRRPALAALVSVAALLVVAVVAVTLVANRRLDQQRREAEQVKGFLQEVLSAPDPGHDGREIRVIDLLKRAATRAAVELTNQPLVRAEIETTLGVTFYQLSLYDEAEPLLRSALGIYERELGTNHWRTAETRSFLGALLDWAGKGPEALEQLSRAVGDLRPHLVAHRMPLISAMADYGTALVNLGRNKDAEGPLRELLSLCEKQGPSVAQTHASALANLSLVLGSQPGRRDESIRLQEQSNEMNRKLPDGQVNLATGLSNLADSHLFMNQLSEGEKAARESLALRTALFGTNSPPTAFAWARLASILVARTNLAEALDAATRGVGIHRATLPKEHRELQFSLRTLGRVFVELKQFDDAEKVFREALEISKNAYGPENAATRTLAVTLGELALQRGATNEAFQLISAGIDFVRKDAAMYPENPFLQQRVAKLNPALETMKAAGVTLPKGID